jgi:hypothetical protein
MQWIYIYYRLFSEKWFIWHVWQLIITDELFKYYDEFYEMTEKITKYFDLETVRVHNAGQNSKHMLHQMYG